MGADRKLFISSSWEPEDIKELLSTLPEVTKLKIIDTHTPSYVILSFIWDGPKEKENRQMNFHFNAKQAGFRGNLITLGLYGSSDVILTTIAERLGGYYEENDCESKIVAYDYPAEGNLEYMLRYSVLRGKCDGQDLDAFVKDHNAVSASWKKHQTTSLGRK